MIFALVWAIVFVWLPFDRAVAKCYAQREETND